MKLILCTNCQDIFSIATKEKRCCMCKKAWGQIIDNDRKVRVSDNQHTIVLGISNVELKNAALNQPRIGWGKSFLAFVIPRHCKVNIVRQ